MFRAPTPPAFARRNLVALLTAAVLIAASPAQAGYTVTVFPISTYSANTAAMDATLGITGYVIEDFEDATFVPGMSVTFSEFANTNGTPAGIPDRTLASLPNLYDATDFFGFGPTYWDGTKALVTSSGGDNQFNTDPAPPVARVTTFTVAGGTTSFGVGVSNFQSLGGPFAISNHDLLVNGVSLGTIEALAGTNWAPGLLRNGYVRIDAMGGDVIGSIGFRNRNDGPALADIHIYDRVAFAPAAVPEPASVALLAVGAAGVAAVRRRARRA